MWFVDLYIGKFDGCWHLRCDIIIALSYRMLIDVILFSWCIPSFSKDSWPVTKGLSQSPDVVYLKKQQKLLALELLLEFLVNFTQEIHKIRTLGQALYNEHFLSSDSDTFIAHRKSDLSYDNRIC